MNAFIRLLYALLIAFAVVAFVGLSIFSFYQPPKSPPFPTSYTYNQTDSQYEKQQKEYDAKMDQYHKELKAYQKNVSIILMLLATLIVLTGIYLFYHSSVIGEGLALGGIGTFIYAVIAASIADSRAMRFIAVTLLLGGILLTAQVRFSREPKK